MRVVYMTREFPPQVYGGAGVHVEYLARAMARLAEVEVQCFGEREASEQNPRVTGYVDRDPIFEGNPDPAREALEAIGTSLRFNAQRPAADVVHCHTWYSHFGGVLSRLAYGLPLVITVHSLEPLRPWKRERLGRGYDLSSWVERTALEMADAIVAVSRRDQDEILARFDVRPDRVQVVPNGVDTRVYRPVDGKATLQELGIDASRPFVLYVGRISRQKGIQHLLRAAERLSPEIGLVLVAASPDSPELEREIEHDIDRLRSRRSGVTWIREMLPRDKTVALFSEAAVFCCPSVYEPFGIINLEAMACETPVVGTAVGGIRETVAHGETGLLVAFEPRSDDDAEAKEPDRLADELAHGIEQLVGDPSRRERMGRRGRQRVSEHYSWDMVAARVYEIYEGVLEEARRNG